MPKVREEVGKDLTEPQTYFGGDIEVPNFVSVEAEDLTDKPISEFIVH